MDQDPPAAPIPSEYQREFDWTLVKEVFELMDAAFLEADVQDGREEDYALRVSPAVARLYAGFLLKQFRDAERLGAQIDPPEFRFRGVRVKVTSRREASAPEVLRETA